MSRRGAGGAASPRGHAARARGWDGRGLSSGRPARPVPAPPRRRRQRQPPRQVDPVETSSYAPRRSSRSVVRLILRRLRQELEPRTENQNQNQNSEPRTPNAERRTPAISLHEDRRGDVQALADKT